MFKLLKELENVVMNNEQNYAYKVNNISIKYRQLWDNANKLAISLKNEGTSPVVVYGHKSVEMIVSIIACLIANRTYIPIDTYTPIDRIKKIVNMSKSTLLICNENICIDNLICMTINEINKKYYEKTANFDSNNEIAYIIFTSGSTGEPKGVPISYDNLENFINWIQNVIPTNSRIVNVLNQASFSFDLSVADLYFSLFNGCTLVAMEKEKQSDLNSTLEIIRNNNINIMVITPTFIKMLLLDEEFNQSNYKDLNSIYFCGEQLEVSIAKKLFERFADINIINAYGPTEATSAVSSIIIDKSMLENEYLPVGRIDKTAVKIEIINDEIVLKGKSVFDGYLNFVSESCFKENGMNCYKTGDKGIIENGLLYCIDRLDNQVKYAGYRIELGDIENNLLKIQGVNDAVVIPKYKENTQIVKNLKAFISVKNGITANFVKSELKKFLPKYMIPKTIVILDKIPVNQNGKYDRKKLKEL